MTLVLIIVSICGFVIHFSSKWSVDWKVSGPSWPWVFAMKDGPMWLGAIAGTVACMFLLELVPRIFGITIDTTTTPQAVLRFSALLAGYFGSSVGAAIQMVSSVRKEQ